MPPIPQQQVAKLLDRIAANPILIARLLNRELDASLLDLAESLGISVFPSRWQDLDMHCSCPDWAVPCKHLAAVIYLLSREIDGNPFLVFSLRGIELAETLKARGILIEQQAADSLRGLLELLKTRDESAPATESPAAAEQIDFSTLPDLAEPLLRILPAEPTFFSSGDFRAIYKRSLARAAKTSRQALAAAPPAAADSATEPFHAEDRPRIEIDSAYTGKLSGLSATMDWPALVKALEGPAAARLPDVQSELAALYYIRLMTLHLLARGAVVPQVFSLGGLGCGLRWLPTTLDGIVRDRMWRLAGGLPTGMVLYRKGQQTTLLPPESQAGVLCSLFLDYFISQWSKAQKEKSPGDPTIALFFISGRARYDGPGQGTIAVGIQAWLARFHLTRDEHSLVMRLEEAEDDDFSLTLAVENGAAQPEPVPLSTVLTGEAWAATRFGILQTVALLAEFFPPLNDHVSAFAQAPITITAGELPELARENSP